MRAPMSVFASVFVHILPYVYTLHIVFVFLHEGRNLFLGLCPMESPYRGPTVGFTGLFTGPQRVLRGAIS